MGTFEAPTGRRGAGVPVPDFDVERSVGRPSKVI